jgi:adenine-specific DNA-methyltransferase
MDNLKLIPKKVADQTLVDYAEYLTDWYIEIIPIKDRKAKGQYFTHRKVSELMVNLFENVEQKEVIKILDPGAGIGIFESTFCEYVKSLEMKVKLSFDLYENDITIIPLLEQNMKTCKDDMASEGFEIDYKIFNDDFILSNAPIFNDQESFDEEKDGYDFVISNPPYYKLNKESNQVVEMKKIVSGQPNIYTLFMAVSAKLLKKGGQMTVLTPRSYCSGLYFKTFRKWFLNVVKPQKIHLFESRKEIFKKYDVLQENVILTASKTSIKPKNILISVSEGIPNEALSTKNATYDEIIIETDNNIVMRIPTSELDDLIAAKIDIFDYNLETLGLKVSTGPVVPFRAKKFLLKKLNNRKNFVSLIWMHNIDNGMVNLSIQKNDIPVGLKRTNESEKILKPNKNYVLIKRFSSKEGKQRINAGIYLKKSLKSDFIGIENHVNYLYKKDGELTKDEAYGIAALLNSKLYNRYFQITNGSTQVNAFEIRSFPLPSLKIITSIGDSIQKLNLIDDISKESIVINALKINKKISRELLTFGN